MQLAGELSKMNLASLMRLVRNSELTGKVCLTQGVNSAFIFFENGEPFHVESDYGTGKEALMELFLWQSGTFSYIECSPDKAVSSLNADEPLERLLKEGISYQESLRYLEQLRISSRTVLKAVHADNTDAFLSGMDGNSSLAEIVERLGLSRFEYVLQLHKLLLTGKALVQEPLTVSDALKLPDWVISRLKQDNPDVTQAIVDLLIWSDRIKCWLYQADVDLERVIARLDGKAATDEAASGDFSGETLAADNFEPVIAASPAANEAENDLGGKTDHLDSGNRVDHRSGSTNSKSSREQFKSPGPPSYEF